MTDNAGVAGQNYGGSLSGGGGSSTITNNDVSVTISGGGGGVMNMSSSQLKELMDEIQSKLLQQAKRNRKTGKKLGPPEGEALDKMAHDPPMRAVYMRHLEASLERYWAIVRDPGPRLWKGEPVIDPHTGEPVPDYGKAVDAIREATGVLEKMARLSRPEPGEAG